MADNELFGNSEQLNDTISRAAVVDEIESVDWYHINENGKMVHGANDAEHQAWYKADDIFAAIERVPSARQERKKGKWIYNSPVTMKCNQCGFVIKDWDWHRFKYCPNCIADMRGESDG